MTLEHIYNLLVECLSILLLVSNLKSLSFSGFIVLYICILYTHTAVFLEGIYVCSIGLFYLNSCWDAEAIMSSVGRGLL